MGPPRPAIAPAGEGPWPPPALLGTLLLVAGEVMLFAGLLFVFWVLRLSAPTWPPPLQPRLPVALTGFNTLVLLGSSVTLAAALRARRRGEPGRLVAGLAASAGLGGVFLTVQGWEWLRLVRFGLTATSSTYGALFYTLIGAHAVHVLAALGWLAAMIALARRGRFTHRAAPLQACALYWHFVVALWPVLWAVVYLV
jgi:heme/copper-type cytochrome/quinol oxidase subunit 3